MRRIILLLLSLSLTLPLGGYAAQVQELNRIVAVVNDTVITSGELNERLRDVVRQIKRSGTPLPSPEVLQRQVLERLILEHIQLRLAQQLGLQVNDEAVNQVIADFAGKNQLTLDQFRRVLERDGFDFAEYRESIRREIIMSQLRARQVTNRIVVTPQEVNALLESTGGGALNVEYHLAHILIGVPEAATPDQVQEARARAEKLLQELRDGADFGQMAIAHSDAQQALEGGDLGWRKSGQLPSLFADVIGSMRVGSLSDLIRSPSGFHILKLLDKRGEQKHVVRQTHARHILIRTTEITSDFEAKSRLERLRERTLNGDDFAGLARAHSEDRGSASEGGDLGWANPGQMVPEFEKAMNETPIGQISRPFKSSFGWHIVQPLARRDFDNTEDFKRAQAQEALRQRKIEEETENWLRQLRDEAYVEYRLEE